MTDHLAKKYQHIGSSLSISQLGRCGCPSIVFFLIVSFTTLLALGCGPSTGPETIPAVGTITMVGEAVEGAVVVFSPATPSSDSQKASQGETDADGNFEIQTYTGGEYKSGIAAGDYVVTVTKLELPKDMRGQPKHLLPKKYRSPSTTPLKASVSEGQETRFDFDLEK